MTTAAQLYQAITGRPHPSVATEHPIRCAANLPQPTMLTSGYAADHVHRCVYPAKRPAGVVGLLEHLCDCGTVWTELSSVGEATTSNQEQ